MADEQAGADSEVTDGSDWTYRLMSLERVQADEVDDLDDIFTATFQVDGPDANAEIEIIVSDADDEAEVVAVALDTLNRAMTAWGRLTENRRIAARDPIA